MNKESIGIARKRSKKSLNIYNKNIILNQNNKIKNKNKDGPPIKMKKHTKSKNNLNSLKINNNGSSKELLNSFLKRKGKIKDNIHIININKLQIRNVEKDVKKGKNENINSENKNLKLFKKKSIKFSKKKLIINNNLKNDIIQKKRKSKEFEKDIKNNFIYKNLNDKELNNLEYEYALILDKRTLFQYYCSLLKNKHILLFTFCPNNDYNLISLKLCIFILTISLFCTINGFFFDDASFHNIYKENWKFNLIFQLPHMIYTSLISAVIKIILKNFALSENKILELKNEKNINKLGMLSKKIQKCLTIKFTIFFFLYFLLLIFFWYFISCFCGVYINTQMILIRNALISFCLSMLYPIGYYLIPGFLRISALRAVKKDKEYLYKLGKIFQLI